jgi:cation diffusion facilitator family transporter
LKSSGTEPATHRDTDMMRPLNEKLDQRLRMKAILRSFLVGVVLMALKFLTYRLTNSSAVLSDALESIINVVASAFAALSVWMAAKPPDPEHPYGHGKIEYFSAGFEGALIVGAAVGIFYTGVQQLRAPHTLPHLGQGIGILAGATIVNLLLGIFLIRRGARTDSISLIADGKHILTDVYTSVGVLAGLALVVLTGWIWLDGVVACLMGLNILITGGRLVYHSYARLMDASDPQLLDRIACLLERQRRPAWINIHQLRAWRAGRIVHIDLHLVLARDATLNEAHQEAKILEQLLMEQFYGNASVLVHMDPCVPPDCPVCGLPNCQSRTHRQRAQATPWNREHLIQTTDTQWDTSKE